jgi:transcriptional regulator with PAS, ATPase and Fis domain
MLELQRLLQRAAPHSLPVLVLGETGTGKELVAREIHQRSRRHLAPLKVVNCAGIPSTLVESVLFGHCRGAFTGADRDREGVFAQAHGGSVFLDEIGELSIAAQAALLRVLETKRLVPVGGDREIEVDVRVIAATHRNLDEMVAEGLFRLDLYHRLNALTLELPPLRERREEIAPLAALFLCTYAGQAGSSVREIGSEAMAALMSYSFPGNVRELRNVIERAVAISEGVVITLADLPPAVARHAAQNAVQGPSSAAVCSLRDTMRVHEARAILDALQAVRGNQRAAAQRLDVPLRTFERKLAMARRLTK